MTALVVYLLGLPVAYAALLVVVLATTASTERKVGGAITAIALALAWPLSLVTVIAWGIWRGLHALIRAAK